MSRVVVLQKLDTEVPWPLSLLQVYGRWSVTSGQVTCSVLAGKAKIGPYPVLEFWAVCHMGHMSNA